MQSQLEVAIAVTYAAAGLLMPLMYWPQIKACRIDTTGLRAFSLSKSMTQLVLRASMLPFVLAVGNQLMTCIVLLDFAARTAELWVAMRSLRRQGWGWLQIRERSSPLHWLHGQRGHVPVAAAGTFDDLEQSLDQAATPLATAAHAGESE